MEGCTGDDEAVSVVALVAEVVSAPGFGAAQSVTLGVGLTAATIALLPVVVFCLGTFPIGHYAGGVMPVGVTELATWGKAA